MSARAFVNVYQDGRDGDVVLLRRGEGGALMQRRARGEWVSYHLASEVAPHRRELRHAKEVLSTRDEGPWTRVSWRSYDARRAVCVDPEGPLQRAGVESYEADVGPARRLVVDRGLEVARPRRVYLDIEGDSRVPFAEKERARVLCFSLEDDDGWRASEVLGADTDEAERELLLKFWRHVDRYDQVVAWGSWFSDTYDFVVIEARTRLLCREELRNVRRLLWLDHCAVFERMNKTAAETGEEKRSYALGAVAQVLLGEGKHDFDARRSWQAWEAGGEERARLVRYNAQDVALMPKIEARTGYLELFHTLCEACTVWPSTRSLKPTLQVDAFMLKLGHGLGHRFPTKRFDDEAPAEHAKYAGAYVLPPKVTGLVRDVEVADFKSMYPNIVITWNMSPDTKLGPGDQAPHARAATGVRFRTDVEGLLPRALRTLLDLRKEWSARRESHPPRTPEWTEADRRATAYKVAANSFYGVMGTPTSRYYDREVAESITQQGVWLLTRTVDLLEKEKPGWSVIAGDTDSFFATGMTRAEFRAFVDRCNAEHYPRLVAETGAAKNTTKLGHEKGFRRMLVLVKKRYVGWYSHYGNKDATADSRPEVKGIEIKRGDAAVLVARLQQQVVALLEGCDDAAAFEPLLRAAQEHVLGGELPLAEVAIAKSLGKDLSQFEVRFKNDGTEASAQPHVALARRLALEGKIQTVRRSRRVVVDGRSKLEHFQDVLAGTKVEFVVSDASRAPIKAIAAQDYDGANVDRHYLWEKMVWPATRRLLEAAFPDHPWAAWARTRPRASTRRDRVLSGQAAFAAFDLAPVSVPRAIKRA